MTGSSGALGSAVAKRAPPLAAMLGDCAPRRIDRVYAIDRVRAELGSEPEHGIAELLAAAA